MNLSSYLARRELNAAPSQTEFLRSKFNQAKGFYRKVLLGHFGCVNAVEFSRQGHLLVSGGDDRRVLVWNLNGRLDFEAADSKREPYATMKGVHNSNIFCLSLNEASTQVYSGGNDEQVLVHDLATQKTLDVYQHDEPVYGISVNPDNENLFATACSDGRVQLFDLRQPPSEDPLLLAGYRYPFHSVMFNPADPRLIATANHKHGLGLWDVRRPDEIVLEFGNVRGQSQTAMSVSFNERGSQVLGLRRRLPPVLFDIHSPEVVAEFDHPGYYNSCTMKSCSFAGVDDEYVMSGSDDFNVYVWRIPEGKEETTTWIDRAEHVLSGHRSIVNQVRFNKPMGMIASAGVEKNIKLWSVLNLPGSTGSLDGDGKITGPGRTVYSREEYIRLVLQSGTFMSHDYSSESTDENPRMMAFFDSLVQREIEGFSSSDDEEARENNGDSGNGATNNASSNVGNGAVANGNGVLDAGEGSSSSSSSSSRVISHLIAKKRFLVMKEAQSRRQSQHQVDEDHVKEVLARAKSIISVKDPDSSTESATEDEDEEDDDDGR